MNRRFIYNLCLKIFIFFLCFDLVVLDNFLFFSQIIRFANLFGFRSINSISGVKPVLADTTQDPLIICPPPEISGIPYSYDETLGYCTTYTVDGRCPSPYVLDPISSKCIAMPICSGSYVWDNQKKQCVPINFPSPGNETEGGGNFTFVIDENATYCMKDLNNDGEIDPVFESNKCVPAIASNGSETQLCLFDAVECDPRCFNNGTIVTKDGELKCSYPVICPSNYFYNSTVGNCTSQPFCPSGAFYNSETNECQAQPGCLANETLTNVSNASSNSTSSQNSTLVCLSNAEINCPSGFVFDYTLNKCVALANCPNGSTLNSSTDKCEAPPGCLTNEYLTGGYCYSNPTSISCPSGMTFDFNLDKCVSTPSCPSGMVFQPSRNRCEASPQCPSGGSYNPITKQCEANEIPYSGTCTYQSSSGSCINVPYSYAGMVSIEVQDNRIIIENYCKSTLRNKDIYLVTQDFSTIYECDAIGAYVRGIRVSKRGNTIDVGGVLLNLSCSSSYESFCITLPDCTPAGTCVTLEVSGDKLLGECYENGQFKMRRGLSLSSPPTSGIFNPDIYCTYYVYNLFPSYTDEYTEVVVRKNLIYYIGTYRIYKKTYCNLIGSSNYYVCSLNGATYRNLADCQRDCKDGYCPSGYTPSSTYEGLCVASVTCPSQSYFDRQNNVCYAYPICPSGSSYDSNLKKCVADGRISCPRGYYDPVTNKCKAPVVCPTGMSYNAYRNVCEGQPNCSNGAVYDSAVDRCVIDAQIACPRGSYDPGLKKCRATPLCGAGMVYDAVRGVCVSSATCPLNGTLDIDLDLCITEAKCANGTTLDLAMGKCLSDVSTYTCPYTQKSCDCTDETTYSPAIDKCVTEVTCPTGSSYDSELKKCTAEPTSGSDCPSGMVYDSTNNVCIASPTCPSGTEFDSNVGLCVTTPVNCSEQMKECVLDPSDNKYKCSPYDCLKGQVEDADPDVIPSGLDDDAGYDNEGNCLGTVLIFSGKKMRCRPSGIQTGFQNCCNKAKGKLYDSMGSFPAFVSLSLIKDIYNLVQVIKILDDLKNSGVVITKVVVGSSIGAPSYIGYIIPGQVCGQMQVPRSIAESLNNLLDKSGYTFVDGNVVYDKALDFTDEVYNEVLGEAALKDLGFTALSTLASIAINDPVISSVVNLAMYSVLVKLNFLQFSPLTFAGLVAGVVMSFFMGSCDQQDILTSTFKESGYCHYVGKRCIKKFLGMCLQKIKVYCCFNSKLARIIHEQGRPQLSTFGSDGSWGSAKHPNCRGFTPEEFQAIDFNQIDFSEYIEDIERNVRQNVEQSIETTLQEKLNVYGK
ncbi:MAG: conjugal transfer protein TraN [Caldisericum sp.]